VFERAVFLWFDEFETMWSLMNGERKNICEAKTQLVIIPSYTVLYFKSNSRTRVFAERIGEKSHSLRNFQA
jgi:hypothetical protein